MISGVLEDEVMRMAGAVAWGIEADLEFKRACLAAKIDPKAALDAPMYCLALSTMRLEGHA